LPLERRLSYAADTPCLRCHCADDAIISPFFHYYAIFHFRHAAIAAADACYAAIDDADFRRYATPLMPLRHLLMLIAFRYAADACLSLPAASYAFASRHFCHAIRCRHYATTLRRLITLFA